MSLKLNFLYSFLFFSFVFGQESDFRNQHFPLIGQSVSSIITDGDSVIIATSEGLNLSVDNGLSWKGLALTSKGNIIALFQDSKKGLWVSFAADTLAGGSDQLAGKGIAYLPLGGEWVYFKQPVDDKDNFDTTIIEEPTTTNVSNITYAITETTIGEQRKIWIASFAGSLRYIDPDNLDNGWQLKTPDGKKLWVGNQNPDEESAYSQRTFSLASNLNELWVGTAHGIYYSRDGGSTFENISYQNSELSGNFVTLLAYNNGILFANCRITGSGESNALNRFNFGLYSEPQNVVWQKSYRSDWVYSLSFNDEFTLVGTQSSGLFIQNERLTKPYQINTFMDSDTKENISGLGIYSSALVDKQDGYQLWVGYLGGCC